MFVSIIILFFSGVGCFILGSLLGYQYGIHHLVKKSKNQDVDDKKLFLERLSFEVSHHKVLPKMIVIIKVSVCSLSIKVKEFSQLHKTNKTVTKIVQC